ncbi:Hypothetical_protein [Hexamita inflata]|uniref:Hypothetical_protein n=1 Tax=Hexamita inflata TaxID=28002 RepID=A0AA86N4L3_9EUKA|nr:Hypothetical protein HINF_LOCUS323 [Hexamita inflata]
MTKKYYITSNADHHHYSLIDPLAFFKKQAEGLQLRANLVDFGLYLASDLVFPFQLQTPFLKIFLKYQQIFDFCYFYVYNDLNSIMYCRLLSFLVYILFKTRQNQYYLINQISKHFSYRPQIQFGYKPFYQQKSKGFVTEHFWGLQVNRGGGLYSRQCSINVQVVSSLSKLGLSINIVQKCIQASKQRLNNGLVICKEQIISKNIMRHAYSLFII